MRIRTFTIWILVAVLPLACSNDRQLFSPIDVGSLVVDAMLYVDKPFDEVFLYRAQSPAEPFNIRRIGEAGATMTVTTDDATYYYEEVPPNLGGLSGVYYHRRSEPVNAPRLVQPETVYRLEVNTQAGERLTASTTTPPRLRVPDWVVLDDAGITVERRLVNFEEAGDSVYDKNQLVYAEGLLEAWLEPVVTAGYQAGIYALDPDSGFVIDPEFLDDEDFEDFEPSIASPPILNTETEIRLPWFAIYFKGRYKIKIFAIDRNWYDLARTVPELSGGGGFGGNAGDDFERPIFHVNGGLGVFGSASMDSVGFYVHPRPE